MVLRRCVLNRIREAGISPLLSDRNSNELASGGDGELCFWYRLAGYSVYYSADLVFQHYIPQERTTASYHERLFEGFQPVAPYLDAFRHVLSAPVSKSKWRERLKWFRLLIKSQPTTDETCRRELQRLCPFRFVTFEIHTKKAMETKHRFARLFGPVKNGVLNDWKGLPQ